MLGEGCAVRTAAAHTNVGVLFLDILDHPAHAPEQKPSHCRHNEKSLEHHYFLLIARVVIISGSTPGAVHLNETEYYTKKPPFCQWWLESANVLLAKISKILLWVVYTPLTPGVTTQNPISCLKNAFYNPILFNGLVAILTTSGIILAVAIGRKPLQRSMVRRKSLLIKTDKKKERKTDHSFYRKRKLHTK